MWQQQFDYYKGCKKKESMNLSHLTPSSSIGSFAEWWRRSWKKLQRQDKKGFNSLCILGAWILLKHRNACVFEGAAPNLQWALQAFKEESLLWRFSGAKGPATLSTRGVEGQG